MKAKNFFLIGCGGLIAMFSVVTVCAVILLLIPSVPLGPRLPPGQGPLSTNPAPSQPMPAAPPSYQPPGAPPATSVPNQQTLGGGWLGVSIADYPPNHQVLGKPPLAQVVEVMPGSPAATAGIRPGDFIVAIQGRTVNGTQEVMDALKTFAPGSRIQIEVVRAGQRLTLSVTLGTRPGNLPQPSVTEPRQQITFQEVRAQDGSFTIKIPSDWTVMDANFNSFQASSPQGEKVFFGGTEVIADAQSYQQARAAMQQSAIPLSVLPEVQRMLAQPVSPPLPPVDVIRLYLPALGAGLFQEMRILGSMDPGSGQTSTNIPGVRAALVYYRYTLMPQQGNDFLRSRLPRALVNQSRVPMAAEALVVTIEPDDNGIFNSWTIIAVGGEGPPQFFRRNIGLYWRILGSIRYDPEVMRRIREEPMKRLEDPSRFESLKRMVDMAGDRVRYRYPGVEGTMPRDNMPDRQTNWWRCPGQLAPVPSDIWPGLGCEPTSAPR